MLIIVLFCFTQVWASSCPGLQNYLTRSLESGLVDLAVAFDDVNLTSSTVDERGDLPCALILAHCSGVMVESINKDDGLVGGHGKAIGKCLVVKCFTPLLKNG
jgi:hypothetical protein